MPKSNSLCHSKKIKSNMLRIREWASFTRWNFVSKYYSSRLWRKFFWDFLSSLRFSKLNLKKFLKGHLLSKLIEMRLKWSNKIAHVSIIRRLFIFIKQRMFLYFYYLLFFIIVEFYVALSLKGFLELLFYLSTENFWIKYAQTKYAINTQ